MSNANTNMRSPLKKVRHLGAAKEGVQHWWIQRVTAVKRNGQDSTLGQAGIERGFSGPIGKAVSAPAPNGGRLIIMPVETSLLPYDPAVDEKSGFLRQIGTGIGTDIMAQYTAAIRKDLGVSINQTQVDQALGQPATQ